MYRVQIKRAFERSFDRLTKRNQALAKKISDAIEGLRKNPRPDGCKKLSATKEDGEDVYRVRVGDFRILYVIRDRALVILLVDIKDRKDAYR
jgi:mRNA interferase RelE/StbE